MHRIALIIPYFGIFPNYFELFLNSCAMNPSIDWIIFTDNVQEYQYPPNVKRVDLSFSTLKEMFQSKFDFEISLKTSYKLCDYKPAYGYLFSEYVQDYDYWGYCDVDLLFGDLEGFLIRSKYDNYDKVGHLGHFSIYRNIEEINIAFQSTINGRMRFKEVFSTDRICVFDEWGENSINNIILNNGKKLCLFDDYFDVYPYDENLKRVMTIIDESKGTISQRVEHTTSYATWENGMIYRLYLDKGIWKKQEQSYIHLQKRKMSIGDLGDARSILCMQHSFAMYNGTLPWVCRMLLLKNKLINKKKWSYQFKVIRYWCIEKSSPLRHAIKDKLCR